MLEYDCWSVAEKLGNVFDAYASFQKNARKTVPKKMRSGF